MKNDLPYFSHDNDARNHAKMKALRARFGWTGYGQFWALNEMIAGAAEARLDLSRKVVRASAACELGMTPDALDDLLKFLADPEECGLVHYDNGILTTDRTQEDYAKTEAGRAAARERYDRRNQTSPEKDETSPENSHTSDDLRAKNDREQSRAEQSRIEQQAAREGLPVDKSEEASLYEFALAEARRRRGVRTPEGLAHKLMGDEKIVHAWREATKPKPPPLPDPPDCECGGGAEYVVRFPGDPENVRRCQRCKRAVYWDDTWSTWLPLSEAKEFDNSA